MKKIRYIIEAITVWLLFKLFQFIGLKASSALGGRLAHIIGGHLSVDKIARNNIKLAMPKLSPEEINDIVRGMWDNLGRTVGELAHLRKFTGEKFAQHVTVEGQEILDKARSAGNGFIIVSGHFSNWEIGPRSIAEIGHELVCVYRKANNPYVDRIIQKQRSTSAKIMVSKGESAAKAIIKELRQGGGVGMLLDQKMNGGIAVPFFAREAMTSPTAAELAQKLGCTLIPTQLLRDDDMHYKVIFHPPIENTVDKSSLEIMTEIHGLFENWITQHPSQWFWVHKRWRS